MIFEQEKEINMTRVRECIEIEGKSVLLSPS
jgi:hypothetical protein